MTKKTLPKSAGTNYVHPSDLETTKTASAAQAKRGTTVEKPKASYFDVISDAEALELFKQANKANGVTGNISPVHFRSSDKEEKTEEEKPTPFKDIDINTKEGRLEYFTLLQKQKAKKAAQALDNESNDRAEIYAEEQKNSKRKKVALAQAINAGKRAVHEFKKLEKELGVDLNPKISQKDGITTIRTGIMTSGVLYKSVVLTGQNKKTKEQPLSLTITPAPTDLKHLPANNADRDLVAPLIFISHAHGFKPVTMGDNDYAKSEGKIASFIQTVEREWKRLNKSKPLPTPKQG